jgi:hypothetical protein
MGEAKDVGDSLASTANRERSLLGGANVLAVPGCNVFSSSWLPLFKGKEVVVMYDSDHPKKHPKTEVAIEPAGHAGARRVAGMLAGTARSVSYLKWGEGGFDPGRPSGFDVRDFLSQRRPSGVALDSPSRVSLLAELLLMVIPAPDEWMKGSTRSKENDITGGIATSPCEDYRTLVTSWRKALRWTDGLDHALAVMLAAVASTKSLGDQLWIKVIGPAACGKSTLCEALSVNRDYVVAKSTIRGFHSGYRLDADDGGGRGEQDHSLIPLIRDKTLVTKDGDTLLQSPNLSQILSEARDLYDSTSRTHYRNAMSKDYCGVRMTWLLCGTSSLRAIDSSELGERFLDCVIMETIDDELEDEILWRVVNRADRNAGVMSDGKPETQYEPELAEAMALTGGYVGWLRENAPDALPSIVTPNEAKRMCARLGKFVAFMRARPSLRQEETAEREFATRLVSQLMRLAKCLAYALNEVEVDTAVMDRVRRVALDTARGKTLALTALLRDAGEEGSTVDALSTATSTSADKCRSLLRFLKAIGVVESFQAKREGAAARTKYRLTKKIEKLYDEVMSDAGDTCP